MTDGFSSRDISLTLRGEEWFSIIAKIAGHSLSEEGERLLESAAKKLRDQIIMEQKGGK